MNEIPKIPELTWRIVRPGYLDAYLSEFTQEKFEAYKQEVSTFQKYHEDKLKIQREEWENKLKSLLTTARELGFKENGDVKIPNRTKPQPFQLRTILSYFTPPLDSMDWKASNELRHARTNIEQTQKILDKKAEEEVKKKANEASDLLKTEAIGWLLERGRKLGEDFTADTAVDVADDIAFEEEVKRMLEDSEWFDFNGQDNCEDCVGWDGESRRCACGNRRVGWTINYGHSFKHPCIYAEAH